MADYKKMVNSLNMAFLLLICSSEYFRTTCELKISCIQFSLVIEY